MFERYTEAARRAIFFGRYEASQVGSAYIEPEYLLLGILREDKSLANRFLRSQPAVDSIRKQIEGHVTIREKVSTSVDLPLSIECKRVLAYAAEEAERLSDKHIGTEHLLLGLLREEKCFAAGILHERGLRVSTIREELSRAKSETSPSDRPKETSLLPKYGRDLTQAAIEGQMHPLVDRDDELKRIVQILCRHTNNNPVLIGELGPVTSAIMEGLAQRIADGKVPSFLEKKRIIACDFSRLEVESSGPAQFKERLKALIKEISEDQNVVVVIEDLAALLTSLSADGWLDAASLVTPPLLVGTLHCVAAATLSTYSKIIGKHGPLARCFQEVRVAPLNEPECRKVLNGAKEPYENFHGVAFDDDAIAAVMILATNDVSEGPLLTKALDLLDEAGAYVQVRREDLVPPEIRDVQKRLTFIGQRMETAIANHEFEKARFYSDEERKERENLHQLQEKHHVDVAGVIPITRKDIDEVAGLGTGAA